MDGRVWFDFAKPRLARVPDPDQGYVKARPNSAGVKLVRGMFYCEKIVNLAMPACAPGRRPQPLNRC